MRSELIGLKGGSKHHYIRLNYQAIKEKYLKDGPEAAMEEFNLRQDTLERMLKSESTITRLNKLSEADRFVYVAAMEANREVKRRVADLEQWKEEVEPVIEFGRGMIRTLGQLQEGSRKIKAPKDPLSLANFGRKLGK